MRILGVTVFIFFRLNEYMVPVDFPMRRYVSDQCEELFIDEAGHSSKPDK